MKGSALTIRPASMEDRNQLASLVYFELQVHRHLEWRTPLEWIGNQHFLVLEEKGKLLAALACPPDPEQVAWIHLFLTTSALSAEDAWQLLWSAARQQLARLSSVRYVAALPTQGWFEHLLAAQGFREVSRVVMLSCKLHGLPLRTMSTAWSTRLMNASDLPAVYHIDRAAFDPLWQNSQKSLELALKQAAWATVVDAQGLTVGYQLSTATTFGGHLARLAVLPEYQGRGIGRLLVQEVLREFQHRGLPLVSVNTQKDNLVSLSIYREEGFKLTGEEFPVYKIDL